MKPDAAKSGKEATSKVNFTIGAPTNTQKFYNETTAGQAFSEKNQMDNSKVDVPNLRSANFNVGNEKVNYTTTSKAIQSDFDRQYERVPVEKMKQEQLDRMIKARQAQFQYGSDKNDYNTSVKQNFVKHDLGHLA